MNSGSVSFLAGMNSFGFSAGRNADGVEGEKKKEGGGGIIARVPQTGSDIMWRGMMAE